MNLKKFVEAMRKVEKDLENVKKGDLVRIVWLDASRSTGVNINKLPLPNYRVETRRRDPRIFLGVQKGEVYHDPHIIVADDEIDDESNTTIDSIPIYLVKRIIVYKIKKPLKRQKADKKLDILRRLGKGRFWHVKSYRDGSMKLW